MRPAAHCSKPRTPGTAALKVAPEQSGPEEATSDQQRVAVAIRDPPRKSLHKVGRAAGQERIRALFTNLPNETFALCAY